MQQKDDFAWHIEQYFLGTLEKVTHLDSAKLDDHINRVIQGLEGLKGTELIEKMENQLQGLIQHILSKHIYLKMAAKISDIPYEKLINTHSPEEEKVHDESVIEYYTYKEEDYFRRVIRLFTTVEGDVDPDNAKRYVDEHYFNQYNNMLWKIYIDGHLNFFCQVNFISESASKEYIHLINKGIFKPIPWQKLLEHILDGITDGATQQQVLILAQEIRNLEEELANKTLNSCSKYIKQITNNQPYAYTQLLNIIATEKFRLSLPLGSNTSLPPELQDFIRKHNLNEGLSLLKKLDISSKRSQLHEILEQEIENVRSMLYVGKIRREAGHDIKDFYSKQAFNDLTKISNLVAICEGNRNLNWLINQVAEYELDVSEDILDALDYEALNIDYDLVSYITYSLCLERIYNTNALDSNNFIIDTYINALADLKNREVSQNIFEVSKSEIIEDVRNNFAKVKELINLGKLDQLRADFNSAYERNDLLEVQRLWSVFTKFQRLLLSSEKDQFKDRIPKKGTDYDLPRNPIDYNDLLDKAFASYQRRAQEYYHRIYLSQEIRYLRYSSTKSPEKNIQLELASILGELERVGREVKSYFPDNNKTNIVTVTLCFVVSSEPHTKGGEHSRIFIPVSLELDNYKQALLSMDEEDQVFPPNSKIYYRNQAAKDYQQGATIMWGQGNYANKIIRALATDVNHSERVLLEVLRKKENIEIIVELLAKELTKEGEVIGKFKVYSAAMFMYSSNSVCDNCTPSIIALQNSHNTGFLVTLTTLLNAHPIFKTRGYNEEKAEQDFAKFKVLTIVSSDKEFTPQARDFTLEDKNPKAKITLPNNAIDLHASEVSQGGEVLTHQRTFIEFVNARFSNKKVSMDFYYSGKTFMSGSKQSKFDEALIHNIEEKVQGIVKINFQKREEAGVDYMRSI